MSLSRTIVLVSLFGLLSLEVRTTQTSSAFSNSRSRVSTNIEEMTCDRFRVTVIEDLKVPKFGVLLREYEYQDGTDRPKLLRSYIFPETRAEFDFRIAATSVYCEVRENSLLIYGRGYDEGGDVIYRIRLDTSSWKYDFSTIRLSEQN